jgi:hypothetical protein
MDNVQNCDSYVQLVFLKLCEGKTRIRDRISVITPVDTLWNQWAATYWLRSYAPVHTKAAYIKSQKESCQYLQRALLVGEW